MSLPYGLDLNNQINVDKSETRFTVTLQNVSSNEMMALTSKAEQWLRDNAPKHMFSTGISPALMFSHITKTNMDSMLKSGFGALIRRARQASKIGLVVPIRILGQFQHGRRI